MNSLVKYLPHALSLSRIPLGVLFIVMFRGAPPLASFSALVIVVSISTDYLDGYFARKFATPTQFGKWLDAFADFLFFFCVYLSFLLAEIMPLYLFLLFVLREGAMYALVRPLSALRKLEVGAKPAGKLKTGMQSIGTFAISIMSILNRDGRMVDKVFMSVSLIILIALIAVSLLSLYWYLLPLIQRSRMDRTKGEDPEGEA